MSPAALPVSRIVPKRHFSPVVLGALISFWIVSGFFDRSAYADAPKPVLWVFAVGVSQYRNPALSLQFADNDASALASALRDRGGSVFRQVNTKVVLNQETSRQGILKELRAFFSQPGPNDVALVALMGHGVVDKNTFYFLPHPADKTNIPTEGLPLSDLQNEISQIAKKVRSLVLVVDTCHAGALEIRTRGLGGTDGGSSRGVDLATQLAPKVPEAYVFSSSKSSEESLEDSNYRLPGETKGHGAFTYALIRGLNGEAARDGVVNVLDLFTYASAQVPKMTGERQHPYVRGEGTNFAIGAPLPKAAPGEVKKANALVGKGSEHLRKGELEQAAGAFDKAHQMNPRDQVAPTLAERAKDDLALRQEPQKEKDLIEQAQKLIKSHPPAPVDAWAPRPLVVTFLDFSTLGGQPERAGLHEALVQRVMQSLQGAKRVQVVERRLLEKILDELKLSATDLSDPGTRLRIGKILVSRLIASGDVIFLDTSRFAFNLRMIDTETSEIAVNLSKEQSASDSLFGAADEIANNALFQLRRLYPIRGQILSTEGDTVILNVGSAHGVTPGTRMKAIVEEPLKVNGEVVAQRQKQIGTLNVSATEEKVSYAQIVDKKAALEKGTKVIEAMPGGGAKRS